MLLLGLIVALMSGATGIVAMVVLVTLTRGVGQSALSVVSLAMVGQWFARRLPLAMGIYAVVMSIGFMVAFPLVGASVQWYGWRTAWLGLAAALFFGLAPLSWAIARRGLVAPLQSERSRGAIGGRWGYVKHQRAAQAEPGGLHFPRGRPRGRKMGFFGVIQEAVLATTDT